MASDTQTGAERYRQHEAWKTLELKLNALDSVHYDDAKLEQWRVDVVEWLQDAQRAQDHRPSALYLTVLDDLYQALTSLKSDQSSFKQYLGLNNSSGNATVNKLKNALRQLPPPRAANLRKNIVEQLDREVEARQQWLRDLHAEIETTKTELQESQESLTSLRKQVEEAEDEIKTHRGEIKGVTETAQDTIKAEWDSALNRWEQERATKDKTHNEQAAEHVAALASAAHLGGTLLDRAVGKLSAVEWSKRGERDRNTATKLRWVAFILFGLGVAVLGAFTIESILRDAQLSVGDVILRTTVVVVIAASAAAALREAGRHFREADSSEEIASALDTLAPFYENTESGVRLKARQQVGEAVLVQNILSRFAHRDASKHGSTTPGLSVGEVLSEVSELTKKSREEAQGTQ